MSNYKLVDLQLHKEEYEKSGVSYHLSAVYQYEDNVGVHEVIFPRIMLPLRDPNIKQLRHYYMDVPEATIDIGFGDLRMEWDNKHNCIYYDKIIKEKIHDMTIEEIEKKLGYKVRVVSGEK